LNCLQDPPEREPIPGQLSYNREYTNDVYCPITHSGMTSNKFKIGPADSLSDLRNNVVKYVFNLVALYIKPEFPTIYKPCWIMS